MGIFKPTLDSGETGVAVRGFVKEYHDEFLKILKPLIPYIAGFYLLDAVITDAYFSDTKHGFQVFSILASYFVTVLVISWHRVVIHGPENYTPMDPFSPKRNELMFIAVGIMIGLALAAAVLFPILLMKIFGSAAGMLVFVTLIIGIYCTYRCSFYFPAKAANSDITLKQAFGLSKGYLWKLICASFYASWRMVLITIGYSLVAMALLMAVAFALPFDKAGHTIGFIIGLPITVYLEPLMTILGVTVLSNYYMYAMQHPRESDLA